MDIEEMDPKKPHWSLDFEYQHKLTCTCLIMVCVVFVLVVHCPLILLFSGRMGVFKDPN